jgi:hypothetical protein
MRRVGRCIGRRVVCCEFLVAVWFRKVDSPASSCVSCVQRRTLFWRQKRSKPRHRRSTGSPLCCTWADGVDSPELGQGG